MSRRRKPARRRLLGRFRVLAQSWVLFAGAIGLSGLVAGSLLTHRLDSLSKQRVRLEAELQTARHDLVRAQSRYARNSAYETVVRRARTELDLVECTPATQMFLALPSEHGDDAATSWIATLAERVDRFANVRGVFAAERDRR